MNFDITKYIGEYVMHCKTKEEAEIFCNYLHNIGRTWYNNETYFKNTFWHAYKEATCYNFNSGTYCSEEFYEEEGYTILEMEDFIGENKEMDYVDSIFKMLNIKPNEPFILYLNGKKSLIKISPDLRSYRPINEFTCFEAEVDEWVDYGFGDIRNILLGKAKIEKLISEEDKKVIDYWKCAGFHYLAKDKNGKVYAYSHKPVKEEKAGNWNTQFLDEPFATTYVKCDFLSWEDDEPYCLD